MKLQLKNIYLNERFSEETNCFKADLFVNGKKVAYTENDGRGGCTYYHHYENQRDIVRQAEEYCKTLPKQIINFGGEDKEYNQTLESVIDDLVFAKEKEKEQKKIDKLCENHIVWGKPNGYSYKQISFNGKPKFADVKKTIVGQIALDNLINRVKSELKEGEEIFNKNI